MLQKFTSRTLLTAALILCTNNSLFAQNSQQIPLEQYFTLEQYPSGEPIINRGIRTEALVDSIKPSPSFVSRMRPAPNRSRNREVGLRLLMRAESQRDNFAARRAVIDPWTRVLAQTNSNKSWEAEATRQKKSLPEPFTYVTSPLSGQILPFSSDKLAQGYRELFSLHSPQDSYKVGLQKTSSNLKDQVASLQAALDRSSACRTLYESVELVRQDFIETLEARIEKVAQVIPGAGNNFGSGPKSLFRQCRGTVELARCEGHCISSSRPSISSPDGILKSCACCEHGELKSVTIRLHDCFLPESGNKRLTKEDNEYFVQPIDFMDTLVEVPQRCQCRECASSLRR